MSPLVVGVFGCRAEREGCVIMGWGKKSDGSGNDSVSMQLCTACEGKGSIVQYKTDEHGSEIPTTEGCGACAGNGFVNGLSR